MDELNLKYTYPFQRDMYSHAWGKKVPFKSTKLKFTEIDFCYVLPMKDRYKKFGNGGIMQNDGRMVEESYIKVTNNPYFGACYSFNKSAAQKLKGTWVYLGPITNHFGHMLRDGCRRFYAISQNYNYKFLIVIGYGETLDNYAAPIKNILTLAGLNNKNTVYINSPTLVEKLILPEDAYKNCCELTQEFSNSFINMASNIKPTVDDFPKKVFFSRSKWQAPRQAEIGLEFLDHLFIKCGYKIIFPEKETLDNQIAYLKNATDVAIMSGSMAHLLPFIGNCNINLYIVNKYPHIFQPILNSCKQAHQMPIFLDFFVCKYPVESWGCSYLFAHNMNTVKFAHDNNCEIDSKFSSHDYMVKITNEYLLGYHKYTIRDRQVKSFNESIIKAKNFSCLFYYDWLNNYAKYEYPWLTTTYDYYIRKILYSGEGNAPTILQLLDNIQESLKISVTTATGVLLEEAPGKRSITTNSPITSLRMDILAKHHDIFYQVCDVNGIWSRLCSGGENATSQDGVSSLTGVRIYIGNLAYVMQVSYRINNGNGWSMWQSDGSVLYSTEGIYGLEVKLELRARKTISAEQTRKGVGMVSSTNINLCANSKLPPVSLSAKRLNRIAAHFGCKTYLEIGVNKGNTFLHVNVPHKTAVDPNFRFQPEEFAAPGSFYFDMTSDLFFANMPEIQQMFYGESVFYDLIYLDGLHTFEQTFMDFIHSLPYSHSRTIWVLDDTVPWDPWSALPEESRNQKYRVLAGLKHGPYHGDVFKCLFALHDYFKEYSWCTQVDSGNGQTIVWRTKYPTEREKIMPTISSIESLTYFDLLDMCYILNIVNDDEILNHIGNNFKISEKNPDIYLDSIVSRLNLSDH